jgi:hypothetical protein
MKYEDAEKLVIVLVAAFPRATLEEESVALYASQFSKLDSFPTGQRTVQFFIDRGREFPTVAEFRAQYNRYRKEELDHESLTRGLPEGDVAQEVPGEIRRFIERVDLKTLGEGDERAEVTLSHLPGLPNGRCDQCHEDSGYSPRWQYGTFALCRPCALSRLRVALELKAGVS